MAEDLFRAGVAVYSVYLKGWVRSGSKERISLERVVGAILGIHTQSVSSVGKPPSRQSTLRNGHPVR